MPLTGEIVLPGDKSVSHRALLINALGSGSAKITGLLASEDVAASRRLVQALGCELTGDGSELVIRPPASLGEPRDVIDCGNSGTTMRIGLGVLSNAPGMAVVTGDHSLRSRPMARIVNPLRALGLTVYGRDGGGLAPLCVLGEASRSEVFELAIASAQVKSALLLAGRRHGVRITEPRTSRDHTERMLRSMGAKLSLEDGWLSLAPGPWRAVDVVVPGDFSSAAFWLVAASAIEHSEIVLRNVGLNPTRTGALDVLRAMGADISVESVKQGAEPVADLVVRGSGLRGARIDGELVLRCIDELPVLAVAAACAEGETIIADAEELRAKESDRIHRVVCGLRALGAEVEERRDGMVIAGGGFSTTDLVPIDADGDHRLAMAFAVAGLLAPGGVQLENADVVRTSYPAFFDELTRVSL